MRSSAHDLLKHRSVQEGPQIPVGNAGPLFDGHASCGKPASGPVEFPTLRSLLQHMDRLGIARAVVWNTEARQHHPLAANQRLLEEHRRTPGAGDRVVPALAFSGLLAYERDGASRLRRQMQLARTRALRFGAFGGRLKLGQTAPVIAAVQDLNPFVLVDLPEVQPSDVLEFAGAFPRVPVILGRVAWTEAMEAYDLMRRCPSLSLDISWLHMWDAIRLAAEHFGAHRLVFGTGSRFHNGAAIAALLRAPLSPEDRDRIAFGNLERLTASEGSCRAIPARRAPNGDRLWNRLLEGRPLGVEIIDAHAHLGPSAGYVLERHDEEAQKAAAEAVMRRLGGGRMIVSGMEALLGPCVEGNEKLRRCLTRAGRRWAAYVAFNPHAADDLRRRLDRWFSRPPFVGFKLLCSYWGVPVTDVRFRGLWEYADRYRLPVLIHTWEGGMDSPSLLRDTVRRYQGVTFILGHSGGTERGRREAEDLALEFPHVVLEWCGSFGAAAPWEDTLRRVGPGKVVYGTDAVMHDVHWELGRLLSLDVDDAVLRPILGANMRRILGRRRRS